MLSYSISVTHLISVQSPHPEAIDFGFVVPRETSGKKVWALAAILISRKESSTLRTATRFNFRVRDGIGFGPGPMTASS